MQNIKVLAAWPSIDPNKASDIALHWKTQGYSTAVLLEKEVNNINNIDNIIVVKNWKGFPNAANILCHSFCNDYDIIVIAGDDLYPDTKLKADIIGNQFLQHFGGLCGIMQPTGDRYGLIDNVAISPWIGSDYIKRMPGPYYEKYYHYYCDAELQDVAMRSRCFHQRPDITQYHDHWGRKQGKRPDHLIKAKERHVHDKHLYEARRRNHFPIDEGYHADLCNRLK